VAMKTVNVLFPDSTHGKFALKGGDKFGALFAKACTKRALDPDGHELMVDKKPVAMEDVVDADALAGAVVAVRAKRDGGMRSSGRAAPVSEAPATTAPTPTSQAKKQERWCAFCGMVLADENAQEFGGVWYHTSTCFKCSQCFGPLKSGEKVFPSRHNSAQPVCEGCVMQQHETKECLVRSCCLLMLFLTIAAQRCGESVRGCFVVTLERGDVHVECMTCNLCKESLVSTGHVDKDGEMLCTAHRGLKPIKDGAFKRPKKAGAWKSGELCLVRLKNAKGSKWRQGIIVHVKSFMADVQVDDAVVNVNVSDLLVTHKAVAVKQSQKELRRGKVVPGDLPTIQRDNSLAQFQRVNLAGRAGVFAASGSYKSPRKEVAKSQEAIEVVADRVLQDSAESAVAAPIKASEELFEEASQASETLAPPKAAPGLRYADDEEVLFLREDGEWTPGTIVTGDAEVDDGPFYLVAHGEGSEDLVAQRDIRRVPFFRVGDVVEARWAEDQKHYRASVDEVIDSHAHTYLVTFLEYGNAQQCTVDFLRPAHDSPKCPCCSGPREIVDGACFFCGQLAEEGEASSSVETPLQPELAEEKEKVEEEARHEDAHDEPKAAKHVIPHLSEAELRATVEALTRENAELRERLNEALRAQQQSAAEVEALRQAGKANRLRHQHSAAQIAIEAEKAEKAAAAAKPLPPRPGGGRRPGGLLRESSVSQVGAGRGKK
jgi:hypothetical protein